MNYEIHKIYKADSCRLDDEMFCCVLLSHIDIVACREEGMFVRFAGTVKEIVVVIISENLHEQQTDART